MRIPALTVKRIEGSVALILLKAELCIFGITILKICSKAIILQAVYFKLRFALSYRDVEELLSIRGVQVDHSTIQRWVFN